MASLIVFVLVLAGGIVAPLVAAPSLLASSGAAIAGEVYMDGNINRIREPLEVGIPNARVVLRNLNTGLVVEESTDVDGYYVFGDLEVATYAIEIIPPAGYFAINNGTFEVSLAEAGVPSIFSTSVRFGLFLPQVSR